MPQTRALMPNNNRLYYQSRLLDRLSKKLRFKQLAKLSINVPKRMGDTVDWLRYGELHVDDPDDFLTTEAVTGAEQSFDTTVVQTTVKQYSNYTVVSDILEFTARDPILEDISDVLGDQAAELLDAICRNELENNLPDQFANSQASLAATGNNDVLTVKEGFKAAIGLEQDSVGPHEMGSYVCVVAPACKGDLMNDTNSGGWVDVHKYTNAGKIMNGEIGEAYGVRYLVSQNISSTTTGTLNNERVYSNILLGESAFGIARLGKDNFQMNIKSSGENSTNDPNNQINTVGYIFKGFAAKYLGGSSQLTEDRGRVIRAGSKFTGA